MGLSVAPQFSVSLALEIAVGVPAGTVPQLDESDAGFRETPGHEAFPAKLFGLGLTDAVEILGLLRFAVEVDDIGHRVLHPEGEFERFNDAFDSRLMPFASQLLPVQTIG